MSHDELTARPEGDGQSRELARTADCSEMDELDHIVPPEPVITKTLIGRVIYVERPKPPTVDGTEDG